MKNKNFVKKTALTGRFLTFTTYSNEETLSLLHRDR